MYSVAEKRAKAEGRTTGMHFLVFISFLSFFKNDILLLMAQRLPSTEMKNPPRFLCLHSLARWSRVLSTTPCSTLRVNLLQVTSEFNT